MALRICLCVLFVPCSLRAEHHQSSNLTSIAGSQAITIGETVRQIDAETLQGEEELIGIKPPGMSMPPNKILLKRQRAVN